MSLQNRRIQRVDFTSPMKGLLANVEVSIVDLSTAGARVEHAPPMKAHRPMTLKFDYLGKPVAVECVVVRSRLGRSAIVQGTIAYQSGLRFNNPGEASRATVREIVASIASERMNELPENDPVNV